MQEQEEGEEGSQCEPHKLSIPTCKGHVGIQKQLLRCTILPARWLRFDRRFVAIHVMALLRKVDDNRA